MLHKKYILFLIIFVIFNSCKIRKTPDYIEEGIIEYEISYYESDDENPIIGLLPDKLELKFNKNNTIISVVGWLGIFSTTYISDREKGYNYTLIKMMNKKYNYVSPDSESIPGYNNPTDFSVEFKKKRKLILGYPCKQAIINIPNNKYNPLTIFYNDKLKLNDHFLNNIYLSKIPGFLFEFPIEINGIAMQLKVKQITPCEVPDSEFIIPADYEKVGKEKMQEIIESII